MSEVQYNDPYAAEPSPELGVIEAAGMAWRLFRGRLGRLWLFALVMNLILMGAEMLASCCGGVVPGIGMCVSFGLQGAVALFFGPQLTAGLVFGLRQTIDGDPVRIGNLFSAFRWRYWESLVAIVPAMILWGVAGLCLIVVAIAAFGGYLMATINTMTAQSFSGPAPAGAALPSVMTFVLAGAAALLVIIATYMAQAFFFFTTVSVWDCRQRYWEIITTSVELAKNHFASVVGAVALFGTVFFFGVFLPAAAVAGGIIGLSFLISGSPAATGPAEVGPGSGLFGGEFPFLWVLVFVVPAYLVFQIIYGCLIGAWQVWCQFTAIYLYRSWRGEPLSREPLVISPDGLLLTDSALEEAGPPASPLWQEPPPPSDGGPPLPPSYK